MNQLRIKTGQIEAIRYNPFQPAPTIMDVSSVERYEVINERMQPNQILIVLTGNAQLANSGAQYIKYYLSSHQKLVNSKMACTEKI